MISGLPGVLNLAAASGMELAKASDIVTDYLGAFGLTADDAGHMADVMAYAQAHANTTTEGLGEAFKSCSANANSMGYTIEETTGMLSIFANAGVKGSEGGTVLNAMMRDMVNNMENGCIKIGETNVAITDAEGNFLSYAEIVDGVAAATDGMSESERATALQSTFTADSIKGMNIALEAGGDEISNFTGELGNCDGAAEEMAKTMQDNLKGKVTELKSALEGAGIAIGENLIPAITDGVKKITEIVSAFNELDDGTKKSIVKFGLVAAAIGPVISIAGKFVTGIGKITSAFKLMSTAIGGMKLAGLAATLGTAAVAFAAVGAAVYVAHETFDVYNRKSTKTREEMSILERAIADMTGEVTYSKDEMIEMGLIYDDFSENVSEEFKNAVKEMDEDVDDFGLTLSEINLDGVITQEENDAFVERVNNALNSCIEAIDNKQATIQEGIQEAFTVDGTLDDNETKLLEWWNSRGEKEKQEAQTLQEEINEIEQTAFTEGRELTPEEEAAIKQRYQKIKQIELECEANNSYEMEYAQNEFQNRMQNIDAEGASKLLQQRHEQYKENEVEIKTNYDTLISQTMAGYDGMSEEDKKYADETVTKLKETEEQLLQQNSDYYKNAIEYAQENNENLIGIIDFTNGKILEGDDLVANERLVKAQSTYDGLNNITQTGTYQMYNTATKSMEEVTVVVDEETGLITGCFQNTVDENGMQVQKWCGYNEELEDDTKKLANEMALKYNEMRLKIEDTTDFTVNANGEVIDSNGKVVGSLETVVNENGEVLTSVKDLNGNPVEITGNWQETISKANETNNAIQGIQDKTVTITVQERSLVNAGSKSDSYTSVLGYATGTESASAGIAEVAEYGNELIATSTGVQLATSRQLYSFTGGETVYNPTQTKKILENMNGKDNNIDISSIIVKLDEVVDATNKLKPLLNKIDDTIENKDCSPNVLLDKKEVADGVYPYISNNLARERKRS